MVRQVVVEFVAVLSAAARGVARAGRVLAEAVAGLFWLALGGLLLVAGLVAVHLRLFSVGLGGTPVSLEGLHALCDSALGQWAVAGSSTWLHRCQGAALGVGVAQVAVILGVGGLVLGAVQFVRSRG